MTRRRRATKTFILLGWFLLIFGCYAAFASGATDISAGMTLPRFTLQAPASPDERKYLGVEGSEPFTLSQIAGKMVIIDVLDVF